MTDGRIRVHLASGDFLLRLGLEAALGDLDYLTLEAVAQKSDEAIASAVELRPHIVLVENDLRCIDGITVAREITRMVPEAKVVMLASSEDREAMVLAYDAGSTSYLAKSEITEDFGPALRMIHRGSSILALPSGSLDLSSYRWADRRRKAELESLLTLRERQLLAGVVSGKTNAALARQLFRSEASVKADLTAVMARMGVTNRVQLAVLGVRTGLVA